MTVKSTLYSQRISDEEYNALNTTLELAGLEDKEVPFFNNALNEAEHLFDTPMLMSNVMAEILQEKGQCSATDLTARGFTLDHIACYWELAEALLSPEISPALNRNKDKNSRLDVNSFMTNLSHSVNEKS